MFRLFPVKASLLTFCERERPIHTQLDSGGDEQATYTFAGEISKQDFTGPQKYC